jgi:hypothetical protein
LAESESKTDLFIMSNGDLLTGNPDRNDFIISTNYADIPVSFAKTEKIVMQAGDKVTAMIRKKNGDVMRGTLVTERFSIRLDIGIQLDGVYRDNFTQVYVDDGNQHASEKFGALQAIKGESEGAQFGTSTTSVKDRDGYYVLRANGIVLDKRNGLEWLAGPDEDVNWEMAVMWVENLKNSSIGPGGKGWRFPTPQELESLYEEGLGTRNLTSLLKTTGWYISPHKSHETSKPTKKGKASFSKAS